MYYKEYLRALRGLRVIAVILGVLLVLAVVGRLFMLRAGTPDRWVRGFESAPGAVVATVKLPDGSTQTTIDDKKDRVHATVVEFGDGRKRITIVEPSALSAHQENGGMILGDMSRDSNGNGTTHVVVETSTKDMSLDAGWFFAISIIFGLITATVMSCTLAKENDGHLELVWTQPVSRETYALTAIGIDIAAIVAAQVLSVAAFLLILAMFPGPWLQWRADSGYILVLALLGPIAWNVLLTAASASLKRGTGAVIGTAWPVAALLPGLAAVPLGQSTIGSAAHQIFHALNVLNPIGYLQFTGSLHGDLTSALIARATASIPILLVLTIVYIALAVLQWRRVEA